MVNVGQNEVPFQRALDAYEASNSQPEIKVVCGFADQLIAAHTILHTAIEQSLDVYLSVGSLSSELTDCPFTDVDGGTDTSLVSMLRQIVDVGGMVKILVCSGIPGEHESIVPVSPAMRDLLLIPAAPGASDKPVMIRATGFDPTQEDGIFHFTLATNFRQSTEKRKLQDDRWYVRAELFHQTTWSAKELISLGNNFRSVVPMNSKRAAELGTKLFDDFNKLFAAAGKRALAGDGDGIMSLNGDQSYVRKIKSRAGGIVAPV